MSNFIDLTLEHVQSLFGGSDILEFAAMTSEHRKQRVEEIYKEHKDELDAGDILAVYEGIHEMLIASSKKAWAARAKAAEKAINAASRINNRWLVKNPTAARL